MAEKILIFKTQGITARATYDTDEKRVTDIRQDTRPGRDATNARRDRLNETDVPGFLDPEDKLDNQPAQGDDLYIHTEGDVIYYVRAQDSNPYTYVVSEFYRELTYEETELTDVSEFGEDDGSFRYELRHGSGYIYPVSYSLYNSTGTITLTPTPGAPAERRDARKGDLGDRNLTAALYQQVFRDALTFKEFTFEFEIEEPICDLLIEEAVVVPESADGALDGSITVTATSSNAVEYRLDAGAWQDSNVFSGLDSGTYTLSVRDKDQVRCIQTQSVIVEEIDCDLAIDQVRLVPESFRGAQDGRITVLASTEREGGIQYAVAVPGQVQFTYQDSNVLVNLPAGDRHVYARLKAANTCRAVEYNQTIVSGGELVADINHVFCGNSPTGRIELTVDDDHPFDESLLPLSYQWSEGTEGAVLENAKPGDYTVDVTTADGRTQQFSYTIDGQPPIVITATVDQGNVNLTVSGGEAPYTFLWSDGATSQNRQGLDPDTYTVTVTDGRGCQKQENIFVRIPQHYFSENRIALEVFAFELDSKPNFTYVCQIYLEEDYLSDEFTLIGEEEHSVDADGKTVFEVNEYLDAYLEPTLPDPAAGLVRLDSQFKRFYLRFTEKFGADPQLSTFSQQETFYVLLGGLSFEEYSTKDFFLHYLPQQRPFYTWQPREKEVFPAQPEFLHYLINAEDLPEFRVWMKCHYADDTVEETQLFQYLKPTTQSQENQYELFRFPAGYDQLSVAGYSCQTCYRYELYVTDGSDVQISEARSYRVNHEYYEHQNFFFFLNSLGCYDTLAATGRSRYQLGIAEETVERELPYDYQPTDRSVEILRKTAEPEVMQPVGYPTKEMMLSLQDFVLSKSYFKWEDERLIPITVSIRNARILDEDENLQELEFSYQLPRMDKFTPKLKGATASTILTAVATVEGRGITLAVSGGKPVYEYLWSDGETDKDRSNLPNGTYNVRITDQSIPQRAYSLCDLKIDVVAKPSEPYTWGGDWEIDPEASYLAGPGYRYNRQNFSGIRAKPVVASLPVDGSTYRLEAYVWLPENDDPTFYSFTAPNDAKVAGRITLYNGDGTETYEITADPTLREEWQPVVTVFETNSQAASNAGGSYTTNIIYDIQISSNGDAPGLLISDLTIEKLS